MQISFFCKVCGKHLRVGSHAKCKKELQRQNEGEASRIKTAARTQAQYAQDDPKRVKFLQGVDDTSKIGTEV